eukprot:2386208-Alexandrium_andersonii.AAC.1
MSPHYATPKQTAPHRAALHSANQCNVARRGMVLHHGMLCLTAIVSAWCSTARPALAWRGTAEASL